MYKQRWFKYGISIELILNAIVFSLDILHGPAGDTKSDDGRNGLVRFVLDRLGIDLDRLKEKDVEQFSTIVETSVVVLLIISLFLILAWVVCRVVRGARICCCSSISRPGRILSGVMGRPGGVRFRGQVIKLDFRIIYIEKYGVSGSENRYTY